MLVLQQYGPQRTGTNAVKALVDHNLSGALVVPDGKHEIPADYKGDGYLISIKDPVSWIDSYYRYRRKQADGERRAMEPLEDLVDGWLLYWQRITTSHLHLANAVPSRTVVIQHEWLLKDPAAVLHRIRDRFDLPWSGEWDLFQQGYAKRGAGRVGAELIDTSKHFDREYHLKGKWVESLSIETVTKCLDFLDAFEHYYPEHIKHFRLDHLDEARELAR